jgi:DNA replication protein DnaC
MTTDGLLEGLRSLGFRAKPEALTALLKHATASRLSPVQTLEQFVALERRERDALNLQRRTTAASIGSVRPLERFDWAWPRSINRALYERLSHLDFVKAGENVLFRGQSGVGKTTLSQHLGLLALQRGYKVRFTTLAAAVADLMRQESVPALERRLKRYTQVDLLVLDEIGYLPCDTKAADLLFNIISRRHEKRSTVISTNLAYKAWDTVFPGAACVGALVDRFIQHCHTMDIDADSWRNKEAKEAEAQAKAKPPKR